LLLTPQDVSDDGSIIVGTAGSEHAFIWSLAGGARDLQTVLTMDYGLELDGWTLTNASGVSADGTVIVGGGISPSGRGEAWIVNLSVPGPSTAALLAIGCVVAFIADLWLRGFQLHFLPTRTLTLATLFCPVLGMISVVGLFSWDAFDAGAESIYFPGNAASV